MYGIRSNSPQASTNRTRIDVSIRLRRAIHLNDLLLVRRIAKNSIQELRNPDFTDKGNTSLHLAASLGLPLIAVRISVTSHPYLFCLANILKRSSNLLTSYKGILNRFWPREVRHLPQCRRRYSPHARHGDQRRGCGAISAQISRMYSTEEQRRPRCRMPPLPPTLNKGP